MQGFVGVGLNDRVRTTSGNRAASEFARYAIPCGISAFAGAMFLAIIKVPIVTPEIQSSMVLPKRFRGQQTHSTNAVGLFGNIIGLVVELITITFPMQALSEQRTAVRTVHDFILTNIEANQGIEEGVTLPADDEARYENIEDGIQL